MSNIVSCKMTDSFKNSFVGLTGISYREMVSYSDEAVLSHIRRIIQPYKTYVTYLANASIPDEEIKIDIIFATDSKEKPNQELSETIGRKTLFFTGINKGSYFLLIFAKRLPYEAGSHSYRKIKSDLQFAFDNYIDPQPFPEDLLDKVISLPNEQMVRGEIEERVVEWDAYLEILGKIAEESQFGIRYESWHQGRDLRYALFSLSKSERALKKKLDESAGEWVGIIDTDDDEQTAGPVIGRLYEYNANDNELKIELNEEYEEIARRGQLNFPKQSRLYCSKVGDLTQIKRLKAGLHRLKSGEAVNRNLEKFIFDPTKAALPNHEDHIAIDDKDLLLKDTLNNEQKKAVEGSLNAPDLYLIQGPPGTGKTTVIAEICYQAALRGHKTLIASQTHLAVDNALGRLVYNPKIRALRKGNSPSMEKEGKAFIEDNVINTWLRKTADSCVFRLGTENEKKAALEDIIKHLPQLMTIAEKYRWLKVYTVILRRRLGVFTSLAANHEKNILELGDFIDKALQSPTSIKFKSLESVLKIYGVKHKRAFNIFFQELSKNKDDLTKRPDRFSIGAMPAHIFKISTNYRSLVSKIKTLIRRCELFEQVSIHNNMRFKELEKIVLLNDNRLCVIKIEKIEEFLKSLRPRYKDQIEKYIADISQYVNLVKSDEQYKRKVLYEKYYSYIYQLLEQLESCYLKHKKILSNDLTVDDKFSPETEYSQLMGALQQQIASRPGWFTRIVGRLWKAAEPWEIAAIKLINESRRWIICCKHIITLCENDLSADKLKCVHLVKSIKERGDYLLDLYRKHLKRMVIIADKNKELLKKCVETKDNFAKNIKEGLLQFYNNGFARALNTKERLEKKLQHTIDKAIELEKDLLHAERTFSCYLPASECGKLVSQDGMVNNYDSLLNKELETSKTYCSIISEWISRISNTNKAEQEQLKQIYIQNANVIGVTCGQSASRKFTESYPIFDIVVIDEVSKATPPELLLPMLKAKKVVLVGDHNQLPPMIASDTFDDLAEEHKFNEERLERLKGCLFKELFEKADEEVKVMLTTQYRMHNNIMAAINQFYEHKLVCGLKNPDAERKHDCQNSIIKENDHIIWIDTPMNAQNAERKQGHSYVNEKEIEYIDKILYGLNDGFKRHRKDIMQKKDVGVITFYAAQERLMREKLRRYDALDLRIGTVDRFQGMEKAVIVVSFVRNNLNGNIGFAKKPQRINVALSRAQELLIIIGCGKLFCGEADEDTIKIYREVIQTANKFGGLRNVLECFGS